MEDELARLWDSQFLSPPASLHILFSFWGGEGVEEEDEEEEQGSGSSPACMRRSPFFYISTLMRGCWYSDANWLLLTFYFTRQSRMCKDGLCVSVQRTWFFSFLEVINILTASTIGSKNSIHRFSSVDIHGVYPLYIGCHFYHTHEFDILDLRHKIISTL